MTNPCHHDFIRYTLDDSPYSQAKLGVGRDPSGTIFYDAPMKPPQLAAYAAAMGSPFMEHVTAASCAKCGEEF